MHLPSRSANRSPARFAVYRRGERRVRPALAFSADGKKLICSLGGETARQFQVDTGREIPGTDNGHRWPVSTLALSDDGKSLYTYGHGDPVRVWDWATGKETGQRGAGPRPMRSSQEKAGLALRPTVILSSAAQAARSRGRSTNPPVSLALSPDGSLVAMRFWPNPEVQLRDAATGQKRYTLAQASDHLEFGSYVVTEVTGVLPAHLVFSPDGRCLAGAGQSRQFCLWDVATGTLLWQLPTHRARPSSRFAFSANSLCLATVNADHTVTLYDAVTGAKRGRLGEADPKKRSVHLADGVRGISCKCGGTFPSACFLTGRPLPGNSQGYAGNRPVGRPCRSGAGSARRPRGRCGQLAVQPRWQTSVLRRERHHRADLGPDPTVRRSACVA